MSIELPPAGPEATNGRRRHIKDLIWGTKEQSSTEHDPLNEVLPLPRRLPLMMQNEAGELFNEYATLIRRAYALAIEIENIGFQPPAVEVADGFDMGLVQVKGHLSL